jgi:hypothetical protein
MARSVIDLTALDLRIQEDLATYGNTKDFYITVWRQEPDTSGCNWNARIGCIQGGSLTDSSWWDVVPQMRERFNLR